MATPSNSGTKAAARELGTQSAVISSDLESELLSAAEDFDRGDFIELSVQALEHCIATGASPWPDESRG
ncbi:MAG: hypothetical protein ABI895_33225 [Deltaproteobacteria bacterium]